MSPKMGLARIACLSCHHDQFIWMAELLHAEQVPCPRCGVPFTVAQVEEDDPELSRVLRLMRELERCRASKREREHVREPTIAEAISAKLARQTE